MRRITFAAVALCALAWLGQAHAAGVAPVTRAERDALLGARVGEIVTLSTAPLDDERMGAVRLKRIDPYAPGARVLVAEGDRMREVPRSSYLHFIADPDDRNAPLLALSLSPDGRSATGVLMAPDGNYDVQSVAGDSLALRLARRADESPDGRPLSFSCSTNGAHGSDALGFPIQAARAADPAAPVPDGAPATRVAVIAVDTDNEFLSIKFANNTTNATNYIAALFTQMNVIYERDLDLALQVGTTILRTTPDPFTNTDNVASQAQLVEFGTFWQNNQAATPRVLAMLLSGKSFSPFGSSGIAWVLSTPGSVYCNLRNGNGGGYSVSQVFTFAGSTPANDVQVVAHELGHNFGVAHTHCTTAAGTFPASVGTLDQCYNQEAGLGCYGGAQVCPGSAAGRTLMSYCHLTNGASPPAPPACGAVTLAFHPVQITSLLARIVTNFPACITPVGPPSNIFTNGFE